MKILDQRVIHLGILKRKQQQSRTMIHKILNMMIPITCLSNENRSKINTAKNPQNSSLYHNLRPWRTSFSSHAVFSIDKIPESSSIALYKPSTFSQPTKLHTSVLLGVRSLTGMEWKRKYSEQSELSWFYSQYHSDGEHRSCIWIRDSPTWIMSRSRWSHPVNDPC